MNEQLVFVDENTGELVQPDSADLTMAILTDYAEARMALDVVRSDKEQYLARLAQTDPTYRSMIERERQYAGLVANVEDALTTVFSDALRRRIMRPISLDIGAVRVTWGKPPERWTQRVKPQAIATRDPNLAQALGIECKIGDPPAPRITVRGEKMQEAA